MARVPVTVELEDSDYSKLLEMAAGQNLSLAELVQLLVASQVDPGKRLSVDRPPGSSGDLYRWVEQKGAIVFTPTNRRAFILNAHAWILVEQALLARFSKGASPILLEMGKAYGDAIALDYRSLTDDPSNVTSYFGHL